MRFKQENAPLNSNNYSDYAYSHIKLFTKTDNIFPGHQKTILTKKKYQLLPLLYGKLMAVQWAESKRP